MSRLELRSPNQAQLVVEGLYKDLERRIESSPPGLCPVDMSRAFLEICHAQSCGKCVPCRVGLGQLKNLITDVLDGKATIRTLTEIQETAKSIMESADCAIGYEAANMVYKGAIGFKDDYVEHIMYHRCLSTLKQPVPCVSRCPARVDIPGYIALVREGRYEDAIRLIRKDNPFPTTCGFICEHPCEALCRRNMIDDAVNIRGLKRMAADAAGYVVPPECAESTGKNIAVVGGGPGGLSAAYFLQLMGHQVTVYEMLPKLGGMLRYGIPNYRLPKERLDDDIQAILDTGVKVDCGKAIGKDYSIVDLKEKYDELRQKIASTTITDEAFNEIESELLELEHKRGVVKNQVSALVAEAQGMCKLDAKVKGAVNSLYSELNAKKLKDSGVDITDECEFYKYQQTLSRQLSHGDFLKVELGTTMALMMR